MEAHRKAVALISENVKSFHERNIPFRIYHGTTNSTRNVVLDPQKVIDTSPLSHILSISTSTNTCIVEPNVAMDALVRETLKQNLVPLVVPEFPGITVGGAYSGTAAESSSFKHGYFDRTVNWVEIVLPNGNMVTASRDLNEDLFHGAAGALGTLGVTTLFEIRLMPTTKLVEITYSPVFSNKEALDMLEKLKGDESVIYLDAIIFSAFSGVVITGRQQSPTSSAETLPVVRFSRAKDPWFCLHVHGKVRHPVNTHCIVCKWENKVPNHVDPPGVKQPEMKELVPVFDYLFRYDRGAFWMGCYGWDSAPIPFNRFTRRILDNVFRTRTMYKIMKNSGQPASFIIQDLAIPTENASKFLTFIDTELKLYPLWLCPILGSSPAPLHTAKGYIPPSTPPSTSIQTTSTPDTKMTTTNSTSSKPSITSLGLWGVPNLGIVGYNQSNYHEFIAFNRVIEDKVREVKGLKWLYAQNYYTEDSFWEGYDRVGYERLRAKWGAEGGLSIWDKVKRNTGEADGGKGKRQEVKRLGILEMLGIGGKK